jgi:putative acetyltransferase
MTDLVIGRDDPRAADVTALLERHLEFARATTPPEFVFALDVGGLSGPAITFCSARRDGLLLAVGALKELDPRHGEVKSMHTAVEARRQGVGAAMVEHLLGLARRRGYRRLSLETGSQPEFEPARALYRAAGFGECDAYGDYPDSPHSVFMARRL